MSWGRPKSTSQVRPLNVRLEVPWTSFQDVVRTFGRLKIRFLKFINRFFCILFKISLGLMSFEKIPSVDFVPFLLSSGFKASTYFFPCTLIVFICFSKAFLKGEYVNFACSIILLWSDGNISSPVMYSY